MNWVSQDRGQISTTDHGMVTRKNGVPNGFEMSKSVCWYLAPVLINLAHKFYHWKTVPSHFHPIHRLKYISGAITFAVLSALKYLKDKLSVIHRDVKPSNILLNKNSDSKIEIKLCDFGIAGNLINSMAKTNVGCKPYMAPERIEQRVGQGKSIMELKNLMFIEFFRIRSK